MAKSNSTQVKQPAAASGKKINLSQEEKISYSVLIGVLLLVALIRSKFWQIPMERDEGSYIYYGKLLLEGGTPYKDFYEQKFPGIFYFFALMVAIFGYTLKSIHIGFMLLNMATIIVLFFAARRLFSPMAAAITAITYGIVSITPNLSGFTIQSEHGVSFFISLGVLFYAFTQKNNHWRNFFLMGLALGCAFMVKTTGVFLGLWGGVVIATDFFFGSDKRTLKEFLKRTVAYCIGVFLVIGLFFLIISLKGALKEMIYWAIEVPQEYVGAVKWEDGKKYLEYTYEAVTKDYKLFWIHAYLSLIVLVLKNIPWRIKLMAVSLMFFSAMTIVPGYYFYGHYWIQMLPGLAILSGLTFYAVNDALKSRIGTNILPKIQYAYLGLFIILTCVHLNKRRDYYFHPNYDLIMRTVYGNNPFPETVRIADFIRANTKPEDNIVSIGSEPELYFYLNKKAPSRHAYFSALVSGGTFHKEWQREFIKEVEKADPKYLVFYNHSISLMVQPKADRYIFEWLNKFITDRYVLVGCVDMVDGYMMANYAWREQLANFKPAGQNVIYVYERKPAAPKS